MDYTRRASGLCRSLSRRWWRKMAQNTAMKYRDIIEAAPDAEANARRAQGEKPTAANDKAAKAFQTYQSTLKTEHISAATAKRKLAVPKKSPAPT